MVNKFPELGTDGLAAEPIGVQFRQAAEKIGNRHLHRGPKDLPAGRLFAPDCWASLDVQ